MAVEATDLAVRHVSGDLLVQVLQVLVHRLLQGHPRSRPQPGPGDLDLIGQHPHAPPAPGHLVLPAQKELGNQQGQHQQGDGDGDGADGFWGHDGQWREQGSCGDSPAQSSPGGYAEGAWTWVRAGSPSASGLRAINPVSSRIPLVLQGVRDLFLAIVQ
jgi:hypothetical protein